MPEVSVIIPAYNCEKFIKETIGSALSQTYQNFELIIIDDGSRDNTKKIVENFNDSRIVYIYQGNSGVSVARNNGILKAKGKYIALLDHDDLWLPEKLEKQILLFDFNNKVGIVYSDSYLINSKGKIIGSIFQYSRPYRGNVLPQLFLDNFIPCLTTVIRRDVFEKIGFFNPKFSICEEYDLFLRIAEKYEMDFIKLPLSKYRVHDTNFSKNLILAYEEHIEIANMFLDHNPTIRNILSNRVDVRMSDLYYRLGKAYFYKGDILNSRMHLNKSMLLKGIYSKSFVFYLLTFLGIKFIKINSSLVSSVESFMGIKFIKKIIRNAIVRHKY